MNEVEIRKNKKEKEEEKMNIAETVNMIEKEQNVRFKIERKGTWYEYQIVILKIETEEDKLGLILLEGQGLTGTMLRSKKNTQTQYRFFCGCCDDLGYRLAKDLQKAGYIPILTKPNGCGERAESATKQYKVLQSIQTHLWIEN